MWTNTLTYGGKQEWPWGQRFPADVGGTGSAIWQWRITFPFGTSQLRLWVMMVCAILKMLHRSNLIHYECQWLGTLPSRRPAITTAPHRKIYTFTTKDTLYCVWLWKWISGRRNCGRIVEDTASHSCSILNLKQQSENFVSDWNDDWKKPLLCTLFYFGGFFVSLTYVYI